MHSPSGLDRVINLSDAVVAIAVTLLILPLVDSASAHNTSTMSEVLSDNSARLLAFGLSFYVIVQFWLIHHAMYLHVVGYTGGLIWINFVWLVSIVFLPFPTELISAGGVSDPTSSRVYIGTMLVTSLATLGAQWLIVRSPELQAEAVRGTLSVTAVAITAVAMAVAFLIAIALPSVGLWALLALVPIGVVRRILARRAAIRAG